MELCQFSLCQYQQPTAAPDNQSPGRSEGEDDVLGQVVQATMERRQWACEGDGTGFVVG